jgi:acyl dehydratase
MTRALEAGMELPAIEIQLKREDLIRYAGASGDFNIIHWNERVALEVGLPGVIAHGMLTMGQAINVVTNYLGSPALVLEYQCRFTRPVVVPDDGVGATVTFSGKVASIDEEGNARIDLSASFEGKTVLAKAFAIVKVA